jgi:enoyl-[acyl-carrier protein] reductase I
MNSVSLEGKKGLVVGVANDKSIAFGCAKAFRMLGADLAITYMNTKAEPHVRPLAVELESPIVVPCDVQKPGELEAVFDRIRKEWGRLDFVLHSIAFAPKEDLQSRVVDCSAAGFSLAMDISCHSFIRMAKLAEPLMTGGGCLMTMSYYGSEKVVEHYNLMGPVKAALECVVRYLAAELGPKGIRVHAISPGPLQTRAASGIGHFDEILNRAATRAPQHELVSIEDVGAVAAFLVGDWAKAITGSTTFVDAGYHIVG